MTKARRSGITVQPEDVPIILAMVARRDRRHDVAAWFGLNQGRIKEVEDGRYGSPAIASAESLPPSGSPGPKALRLRHEVEETRNLLIQGDTEAAKDCLDNAIQIFDQDE